MTQFPQDLNGDVLRRMLASGDDLSRPRDIEFVHVMPSETAARQMSEEARKLGHSTSVSRNEDSADWETTCVINMVPTHAAITATEETLARLAERFGGYADGWGCFEVQ